MYPSPGKVSFHALQQTPLSPSTGRSRENFRLWPCSRQHVVMACSHQATSSRGLHTLSGVCAFKLSTAGATEHCLWLAAAFLMLGQTFLSSFPVYAPSMVPVLASLPVARSAMYTSRSSRAAGAPYQPVRQFHVAQDGAFRRRSFRPPCVETFRRNERSHCDSFGVSPELRCHLFL